MKFTGERYLPELDIDSEITVYHLQRYLCAANYCKDKVVVDIACGEGYGSDIMGRQAKHVYGIDISEETVKHARVAYGAKNLSFLVGSVDRIPLADASAEVLVSFETIEHVSQDLQLRFLKEIKRVLKSDGICIISSPDKKNYSDLTGLKNEYHVHELYHEEFIMLMKNHFRYVKALDQYMTCMPVLLERGEKSLSEQQFVYLREDDATRAEYNIAICSDCRDEEVYKTAIWDASNRYYRMLDMLRSLRNAANDPDGVIEQKENFINEQRRQICDRDHEIMSLNGVIENKENYIGEQREQLSAKDREIMSLNGVIENKENYIGEQREQLSAKDREIMSLNGVIENKENYIGEQREQLSAKDREILSLNGVIENKENYIGEQREQLSAKDREILSLNGVIQNKENYINEQQGKIDAIVSVARDALPNQFGVDEDAPWVERVCGFMNHGTIKALFRFYIRLRRRKEHAN